MRILDIIEATTVDGPGFRTAVYFAGCAHGCPGCHNPQSHDFKGGYEISVDDLAARILATGLDVTLTGGDPVYQMADATALARLVRESGHTVWLYTGYTLPGLLALDGARLLLRYVDVVVDGPFMLGLRDTGLQFRGSSNQRVIDVRPTLESGDIVLWHSDF